MLLIFAIAVIWIYLLQPKDRRLFKSSFFITSILGVIFFGFILSKNASIYLKLPLFLFFGAMLFIILGLSNTIFTKKRQIHSLVNTILGICFVGAGILAVKNNILGLLIAVFISIALTLKEYLFLQSDDWRDFTGVEPKARNFRLWTIGMVGALLTTESIFFTKTLPLPLFSFLGVVSLFFVVIRKLGKDHIKGVLRLNTCLEQALIMICGIIITLASGEWGR